MKLNLIKRFEIKISSKEFLLALKNSAFIRNLFIENSKYANPTEKDLDKLFDPTADFLDFKHRLKRKKKQNV